MSISFEKMIHQNPVFILIPLHHEESIPNIGKTVTFIKVYGPLVFVINGQPNSTEARFVYQLKRSIQ